MGIRRAIRKLRRYRYQLILIINLGFIFAQAEYQIITIPKNALQLSTHNGFENIRSDKHLVSFLQYPAQINLLNVQYKKIDISILNYGLLEDRINNIINNQFRSYEGVINYNFNKNIFNFFNLYSSFGSLVSKIDTYTSIALITNINLQTTIPASNIKLGIKLKNVGIILKNYTNYKQNLPLTSQLYIIKKINQNINIGYHLDYYHYIKNSNHIFLTEFEINEFIQIRFSNTTYSKQLYYNNKFINGLALGLSITTQKKYKYDFSLSSLGIGGYIYGITMQF